MQRSSISNSTYSGSLNGHGFVGARARAAKNRLDHLRSLVQPYTQSALNRGAVGPRDTGSNSIIYEKQIDRAVSLSELLTHYPRKGTGKFALGLDGRQRLVQFDIHDSKVGNVLISGVKGAGKSALLRTVGASLALENRQSDIQLCIIELRERDLLKMNEGESLRSLGYLPHTIFPVIRTTEGGMGVIDFLAGELDYRRQRDIVDPLVVIIIDGIDRMLQSRDRALYRKLGYLLNHGPSGGYRIFLSVEDPISKEVRPLLKHNLPLRLVGKAADADRAWAASGITGTKADKLAGTGDFIAVRGGASHRFQSAYISDEELYKLSNQLEIQKGRVLLANPLGSIVPELVDSANCNRNLSSARNGTIGSGGTGDSEGKPNDSGSDAWLTADWEDRFWMDRI